MAAGEWPHDYTATVAEAAERVLADLEQVTRWVRSVGSGQVGKLRVGMIDIAAVHHCRDAVRKFRRAHPRSTSASPSPPPASCSNGWSAANWTSRLRRPRRRRAFDSTPLLRDELAVYAPPGVAADVPPAQWGPWLLFPSDSRTRTGDRPPAAGHRRTDGGGDGVAPAGGAGGDGASRAGLDGAAHHPGRTRAHRLARAMAEPLLSRTISAVTRRGGAQHPAVAPFIAALGR
jgi:DNA-binding transcriptional LysR family regulator